MAKDNLPETYTIKFDDLSACKSVAQLYETALKDYDGDGFYAQIDSTDSGVEFKDRESVDKFLNDKMGDWYLCVDGADINKSGVDFIPEGTRRVVVLPFGHRCPNCGGSEALITFFNEGNIVLLTLYADFG